MVGVVTRPFPVYDSDRPLEFSAPARSCTVRAAVRRRAPGIFSGARLRAPMGAILEAHFAQTAGSRSPELNIMCQSLYCGLVNVRKMASAGAGEQSAVRIRVIVIVVVRTCRNVPWGIRFATTANKLVLITSGTPGSVADDAGLKVGVIIWINGKTKSQRLRDVGCRSMMGARSGLYRVALGHSRLHQA